MFLRVIWVLAALVVFAQASGEFVVLNAPDSVVFKGNKELDQSLLKEVFSVVLGFTPKLAPQKQWDGIFFSNVLNLPEAVVAVAIEGVDSLKKIKGQKYPLNVDEVEETTWQTLSGRIGERDKGNTLIRINLGDGLDALGQSALGELKPLPIDQSSLKVLSLKNNKDRQFLDEVQLLHAIAKKVSTITPNNKADIYWLVVSGLRPVFDQYGNSSLAANEALTLLNEALQNINKAFKNVYKNKVLITAFTNDASQVSHNRNVRAAGEKINPADLNLATVYSEDYPVIFNIILWFGVVFFFSLLAICITIAEMDPGRDSIIYRMTSNRMKKDN